LLPFFANMSTLLIAKSDSGALQVLVTAEIAKFDVTPEATTGLSECSNYRTFECTLSKAQAYHWAQQ
jgi:hypothetical protein